MVNKTIPKKIYDLLVSWKLVKASSMSYGAVNVGTTATIIVGSQPTRTGFIIANNSTKTIYLGGDSVTTANGIPLEPGACYENQIWTGAFYGIVESGTANVRVEDFY